MILIQFLLKLTTLLIITPSEHREILQIITLEENFNYVIILLVKTRDISRNLG